ncbi:MAG: hypothetical protein P4L83_11950 [Nevskia sp.]|nr:hypothetical protein [Nevskia sp.]
MEQQDDDSVWSDAIDTDSPAYDVAATEAAESAEAFEVDDEAAFFRRDQRRRRFILSALVVGLLLLGCSLLVGLIGREDSGPVRAIRRVHRSITHRVGSRRGEADHPLTRREEEARERAWAADPAALFVCVTPSWYSTSQGSFVARRSCLLAARRRIGGRRCTCGGGCCCCFRGILGGSRGVMVSRNEDRAVNLTRTCHALVCPSVGSSAVASWHVSNSFFREGAHLILTEEVRRPPPPESRMPNASSTRSCGTSRSRRVEPAVCIG